MNLSELSGVEILQLTVVGLGIIVVTYVLAYLNGRDYGRTLGRREALSDALRARRKANAPDHWSTADSHRPREAVRAWAETPEKPEPIELSPAARRYIDMRMLDAERRIQKLQRTTWYAHADIDWDAEVVRAYAEENGHPDPHTERIFELFTAPIGTPITPEAVADTLRRARATSVSFHG